MDWTGILIGFAICFLLFELVRKGYFKWVGRSSPTHKVVKSLIDECSNWAMVAMQDKSTLLALTHANYAVSYVFAVKQIATPEFIYEASNVHIDMFESEVKALQRICVNNLTHEYPELSPPGSVFSEALNQKIT